MSNNNKIDTRIVNFYSNLGIIRVNDQDQVIDLNMMRAFFLYLFEGVEPGYFGSHVLKGNGLWAYKSASDSLTDIRIGQQPVFNMMRFVWNNFPLRILGANYEKCVWKKNLSNEEKVYYVLEFSDLLQMLNINIKINESSDQVC